MFIRKSSEKAIRKLLHLCTFARRTWKLVFKDRIVFEDWMTTFKHKCAVTSHMFQLLSSSL